MGLFNAHAVAQQRADRITTILHSLVDGNLDVAIGEAPAPGYERLYDGLRNVQRTLREQRAELAQNEALEAGLVEMTRQHDLGWIDEVIPADKLSGRQARIAKGINDLVAAHIAVKMKVVSTVTAYGRGDLSVEMDRLPGKKAVITEAIDGVRASLKASAEAAEFNVRIKSALDNVTANVMIADRDFNIVYMNQAVGQMFLAAEADIRKELPDFRASNILGGSIDRFHKHPAHQRGLLDRLAGTYEAKIKLGGRTLTVVANPVINEAGERLGAVVEWQDITEQLAAREREERIAGENARIKSALDNVTANVMIADRDFNIVYMNQAVGQMFLAAEADIRQELPDFRASNILGGSIDRFHKHPGHQRGLLDRLAGTYEAKIKLGGRTLTVVANPVLNEAGERLGAVVEWQDITEQLAAREREQRIAGENARIKSALDNCSTNVMIADGERNIIYMNKTVTAMLQNAEADLRKALPSFSVSKLMGGSIDQFHKHPEHQQRLLATFTSTFRTQIEVGGRTFGLVANPVMSDSGERLGSVVEWNDRTLEVNVEREVAGLVNAAAAGDFSRRISEEGKSGFLLNLTSGLNQLVDTADKGLRDVTRMLAALSQGDLTQRIDADYQGTFGELKDYSNETAQSLSRMLGQIREAADTIHTAASEIASGNAELSTRTEQQASSLEETASSMEELTSTVKLNAENARQANSLAVNASEVATEGGNVVQKVVGTMSAINDSARKIADIIGVIDGIAFQTNILALNAAVEAARAGEQGRGFAVVAGEVRTLAQRSAAAAKEIKTLINDSVDKVENGNTLVAQAGQTMSDIVVAIKRVTDIMAEIAAASAEQSSGIEEVNGAVSQMDEMTQQNAALVEEAAASAEALQEQAGLLNQSVSVFKLDTSATVVPLAAARPARTEAPAHSTRASRGVAKAVRAKGKEEDWEEF
ncbi:methyl-accepting chemotaxis protein [Pseudomonas sp. W03]|uniref:methyl-accepting chemotaxis protein n=1 Tax=Pseudomonas sp. W03 TaxID=3090666 RepID=UPI003A4E003D